VLLALVLRVATLGVQSLDGDEGFTAQIAGRSFGDAMSQIPRTESTPPLYYALVWLWTKVFGTGEWGLRSLSALAGVMAIPVIYAIGATLRSPRVGLVAAAFAAVSPLLVWYSQEARSYMLFMLLAAVAFLCLLRGRVWLWALACAAALATHYFAAVVIAPMALWMLWRRVPRARWAIGAVTLAGLALAPLLLYQNEHVTRSWAEGLTVKDEVAATSQSFLIGMTWPTGPGWRCSGCWRWRWRGAPGTSGRRCCPPPSRYAACSSRCWRRLSAASTSRRATSSPSGR
jgi:4-amino-4-deoxy-L-arabinose transferase-like glycosyltransferase